MALLMNTSAVLLALAYFGPAMVSAQFTSTSTTTAAPAGPTRSPNCPPACTPPTPTSITGTPISLVVQGTLTCSNSFSAATTGNPSDGTLPFCGTTINTAPGILYAFDDSSATGSVNFQTCGSPFDTKLAIFEDSDCDGDLECLNGNDDSCGLSSEVLIDPICSPQYFVYVTGFGSASGSFTLDAACTAAPAEIF